jgi:hypothetical protein
MYIVYKLIPPTGECWWIKSDHLVLGMLILDEIKRITTLVLELEEAAAKSTDLMTFVRRVHGLSLQSSGGKRRLRKNN